jgi:hypothetical protein
VSPCKKVERMVMTTQIPTRRKAMFKGVVLAVLWFLIFVGWGVALYYASKRTSEWRKQRRKRKEVQQNKDGFNLNPLAQHFQRKMRCPDCGGGLLEGPSGGLCVNVMCDGCGNKFNIGIFCGRVMHAERIGR